jgi:hypothetical protein
MQKWTYFSMGIMAGLILLLGGALLMQGREPSAYAMQGVDSQGKFTMGVGSSEPNKYDMLWVLHEHPPHPKLKMRGEDDDASIQKGQRISLCLYKIEKQGEKMRLIAARDIAYDVEIIEFGQEKPTVREVMDTLKKSIPKEK